MRRSTANATSVCALTQFQVAVQEKLKAGNSILLIAPTGLGKTLAVTADIQDSFRKIVYSVPLRALGVGIKNAIGELSRSGVAADPKIHHGDQQDSYLFSEEVVVTTYDQVVCAVPGLPLSLPLSAGHAVAAAVLMSRLVLDEAHLARGISPEALPILLGIVESRAKLGLQTVVMTATLPDAAAKEIADQLGLVHLTVGDGVLAQDEALELRERNRRVNVSCLELKKRKGDDGLQFGPLDERLAGSLGKTIYFANTVERLQDTYDRILAQGMDPGKITVLHNRMPRSWRARAERDALSYFGKDSPEGSWLLLTNQVAEAGLDISAPLVISDPAPVDTLVQRAGRCARWFRVGKAVGEFVVVKASKKHMDSLSAPYQADLVELAMAHVPKSLSSKEEREWINAAWSGEQKKKPDEASRSIVRDALNKTTFALNLFDRAAQDRKPGEIARAFREIVSVEVAVDDRTTVALQRLLDEGKRPETSSVSLGRGWSLLRQAGSGARVIRFEDGGPVLQDAQYVRRGDVLVVPSTVAYLHEIKGLCFPKKEKNASDSGTPPTDAVSQSEWNRQHSETRSYSNSNGQGQTLLEHTEGVMDGTYRRLASQGEYRNALLNVLRRLEPQERAEELANVIAQVAKLAAGFHDLGKTDARWQQRAHEINGGSGDPLIGRTSNAAARIGVPHTPPSYLAIVRACELLLGELGSAEHLIRAIALAATRHHSSLANPASIDHSFSPAPGAEDFLRRVLDKVNAPPVSVEDILEAGGKRPNQSEVPLLLPNDDLFPIYALVGRAILLADREDAAGRELEQWTV